MKYKTFYSHAYQSMIIYRLDWRGFPYKSAFAVIRKVP